MIIDLQESLEDLAKTKVDLLPIYIQAREYADYEAEEREDADDGKMLKRVVALQDLILAAGVDGINQWLRKIESR